MSRKIACAVTLALLMAIGAALAADVEEEEPPVFEAEPLVVVATGEPADPGTLPTSISVITRTEIERSGYLNLMDLLVREPGVWVRRQGGLGYGGTVSIRGFGGSPPTELMVLVDGHPSEMAIMGHILPSSYLLDNVERVEILRGPSGALHGDMAMGGVINIVTRAAGDEAKAASARATAGTFDTNGAQVWISGRSPESSYRAQAGSLFTEGSNPFGEYRADNRSIALTHQLGADWSADFRAQQVLYRAFDQTEVAKAYAQGRQPLFLAQHFNRQDYDLEFTHGRGDRRSQIKLYRTAGDHDFQDGFHSKDYANGIMLSQWAPVGRGRIVYGADWRRYGGDIYSPPPLVNDFNRTQRDAHFVLDYPTGGGGQVTAGLRYAKPEDFDAKWLPTLGYYRPITPAWSAFGSVRRGYRVPSFRELFLFGVNNPDLRPETVLQYEVGARRSLAGGGQFDVSVFQLHSDNLIIQAPRPATAPPGPPLQLQNVGDVTRRGFELGLRRPVSTDTAVYANFSYLNPGDIKAQTVGRRLAAGVDHRSGKWMLSGDVEYVDRLFDYDQTNTLVEVPSFIVVNLKVTRPLSQGVRAGLVVENLFDRTYRVDPAYPYPMPGRAIRVVWEMGW